MHSLLYSSILFSLLLLRFLSRYIIFFSIYPPITPAHLYAINSMNLLEVKKERSVLRTIFSQNLCSFFITDHNSPYFIANTFRYFPNAQKI